MGGMMGFPGGFGGGMQLPEGMEIPGFNFEDAEKLDPGMVKPEDLELPEGMELPEGVQLPEGGQMPNMQLPEGMELPEGMQLPEGAQKPAEGQTGGFGGGKGQRPSGDFGGQGGFNMGGFNMGGNGEVSTEFVIAEGGNYFTNVTEAK